MSFRIIPVVMSGGVGSRLWPMSRAARPKQMQALVSDKTLLQDTLARVAGSAGEAVFAAPVIIANQAHADIIADQLSDMGCEDYTLVLEPFGRNTAPVVACAASLPATAEDDLILVLPADHHIRDVEAFRSAIAQGAVLAADGHLVTFGVKPDHPHTGYGYIRSGEALGAGFAVDAFVEKPDKPTAQSYVDAGGYCWNAGIFLMRAGSVLSEMRTHCPDVLEAVSAALAHDGQNGVRRHLNPDRFETCPSISFDYAVMEKTDHAAVLPIDVGWDDVGSWSALWEMGDGDTRGNVTAGDATLIDCRNLLVRSEGVHVATVGVSDLVVVATKDAVLVIPRDRVQDVKSVVDALKSGQRDDLL